MRNGKHGFLPSFSLFIFYFFFWRASTKATGMGYLIKALSFPPPLGSVESFHPSEAQIFWGSNGVTSPQLSLCWGWDAWETMGKSQTCPRAVPRQETYPNGLCLIAADFPSETILPHVPVSL